MFFVLRWWWYFQAPSIQQLMVEHSILTHFSVTNSSVGLRTAVAGNVGAAILTQVAVRESMLLFVTEKGLKVAFFALAHVINFI